MDRLDLIQEPVYLETDLSEPEIRRLIINNKQQLGLIDFEEHRTPQSLVMVMDGIDNNELFRVSVVTRDKNIFTEVDIAACGSGAMDMIKAKIFNSSEMLYSMEAARYVRNSIFSLIKRAEREEQKT